MIDCWHESCDTRSWVMVLAWRDSIPGGVREDPAVHTWFEGTPLFNRAPEPEFAIRGNATTHWPEYLMEAVGLGVYMMSACTLALLLSHPSSLALTWIPDATTRRILMGIGLGAAVAAFIYSPWGMQSGAHLNPAITLTFFRLGKVAPRDMVFYSLFQVLGGITGVLIVSIISGRLLAHPAVNYAVTVPGRQGMLVAFLAETIISFNQMTAILWFSNSQRLARFTGCAAAALIAINISAVAPLSGMSMNPARSVASAVPAVVWSGLWIYLTAPPLAMLLAAEVYLAMRHHDYVRCAKLHHDNDKRCIFCEYGAGSRAHGMCQVSRAARRCVRKAKVD